MKEKSRKWVEAAKLLIENPTIKVVCPECEKGFLQVKDEPIEIWKKLDRYLICDSCGKWNVITMASPDT